MPSIPTYFDQAASTWDDNPVRVALTKGVGEAILREARPTREMDVLDYGCGTGLVGLYLLPHVRSVTGADSSAAMLKVLQKKIADGGLANLKTLRLDLERDPMPKDRYHLVVACMVLHHTADTERVLRAFHGLLRPGGVLCIADLDKEPGVFHSPEAVATVHHLGFDRATLKSQLGQIGFDRVGDTTAHVMRKPTEAGQVRDFPVFLVTAR
jgi:ubiquinone/menaquinone biosynthesis C-methylase UbiE